MPKRKGAANRRTPNKRPKPEKWSAENALQNPKGPLATVQLRNIFSQPAAFDSLSEEQKATLISLMPAEQDAIKDDNGRITIDQSFLNYDPDFQHALGRVQEDIVEGRNDPEWLEQAITAHEERKLGKYDNYKEEEFETFWGIKQKIPHHLVAGLSSGVHLNVLFRDNALKNGDLWVFNRKVKGENGESFLIEKELKVIDVSPAGYPAIAIPPGQYKMSHPSRNDVVLPESKEPGPVVKAVMDEDGRLEDPPKGNGWKLFRVVRDNQDLGSLWDIRQDYHFSQNERGLKPSILGSENSKRQ